MKKILLILGHPDNASFCSSLASAYEKGAKASGQAEVRRLDLGSLRFDPILHNGYNKIQALEPDLESAQADIKWADHIVIVFPIWWGSMPAVLKGFFDRALLPGFGFKYHQKDPFWDKLLIGRSARLIVTSDSPSAWDFIVNRNSAINTLKRPILQFCGIKPVRVTRYSPVRSSTEDKRKAWLTQVESLGAKLL